MCQQHNKYENVQNNQFSIPLEGVLVFIYTNTSQHILNNFAFIIIVFMNLLYLLKKLFHSYPIFTKIMQNYF